MLRANQKLPIFQFFTSMYYPVNSFQVFCHKNEKGEFKLLSVIKIYQEKKKKIKAIDI